MTEPNIREAIDRVTAAIAADPTRARVKSPHATARLIGGLACEVTGPRGERVVTDMPPGIGGGATGPNPAWLLRAAMASCTATVVAMRAAKLGVALTTLEITVESESDTRGMLGLDETISAGLNGLRTVVRIGGDATPDVLRELVTWADAHSPVCCTIGRAAPCPVAIEVVGDGD